MFKSACTRSVNPSNNVSSDDRWSAIWVHHDALLALARPRVASESDAEDVVHEAMALAATKFDLELRSAGAWLNRVVRNRCVDLARERSYASKHVVYEHGRALVQSPTEDLVCDRAEAAFLSRLLHTLPTRQQEALIHASDGMSNAQIAARMSTTVKAIESLLVKARRTLRAAAAAAIAGLCYVIRRPVRHASSAAGVVALTVGLTLYSGHPVGEPPPGRGGQVAAPKIEAELIAVPQDRPPARRVAAPTRTSVVRREVVPVHAGVTHRGGSAAVHAKVGPSDTKVSTQQYGNPLNPIPDIRACLAGGVVVSSGYVGCADSPGRPAH